MSGIPPADLPYARALRWALFAVFLYALLRTAWLCDDAFITFRVVDNFVHGFGLRWNVADRVQVFTHPLWTLLLTVPYSLTREIFHTSLILSLLLSATAGYLVGFRIARDPAAGLVGLAILVTSKAFIDYSTSGLENALTHLLLALFVLRPSAADHRVRDVFLTALLAGLGMLNRLDTALLFLPALAGSLRRERRPRAILAAALGFVPLAAWLVFATLYYGCPVPNTALAKLKTGIGATELAGQGLWYFWNSLLRDPVTLLAIVAALVSVTLARTKRDVGLAVGIVLYLAYVVSIGGDFMSGRFFSAPLLCAVAILASRGLPGRRLWGAALAGAVVAGGLLAPYPVLLSGTEYGAYRTDLLDEHGIADERAYYFWMSGLFNGRDGPKPGNESVSQARAWKSCGYPVAAEGAIGFVGFVSGPGLHIVDYHGLADPLLARLPVVERDPLYQEFYELMTGRECRQRFRIGHFLRALPPGYLGYLLGQEDALEDERLRRIVQRMSLITRGPLLTLPRLRAIVLLNLGRYDELFDQVAERRWSPPRWEEVIAAAPWSGVGYARRAALLGREGRVSEAEPSFREALRLCPEDTDSAVTLAVLLWQQGRDREALELCRRAVALDPWLERAYNGLGFLYTRSGNPREAIPAFSRAIALDPTMADAYLGKGIALSALGRLREAEEALEATARLRPRDADAHERLGTLRMRLGDAEGAARAWRRAAELGSAKAREALELAGDAD